MADNPELLTHELCKIVYDKEIPPLIEVIIDPTTHQPIMDPTGKPIMSDTNPIGNDVANTCAPREPDDDDKETDIPDGDEKINMLVAGQTVENATISQIHSDIIKLIGRQQTKYQTRIALLRIIGNPQLYIEQSIIQVVQEYYTTIIPQDVAVDLNRNLVLFDVINKDSAFFNITVEQFKTIPSFNLDLMKNLYYYFSAWDSPILNNSFIVDTEFYMRLNEIFKDSIASGTVIPGTPIYVFKKRIEKPLPVLKTFFDAIYFSIKIDGENIILFEFIGLFNPDINSADIIGQFRLPTLPTLLYEILERSSPPPFCRITPSFLTINFPQLAFLPATKDRFPIQTAITTIFALSGKVLTPPEIAGLTAFLKTDDNLDMVSNMIMCYKDIINVTYKRTGGGNNLATECNNGYGADPNYVSFANNMDTSSPGDPISFNIFTKYIENYIVNFCIDNQPSLKMVAFLKITYLNEFMIKKGWGFVDTAGGSLFNYIDKLNIVTADYDFKIYFYQFDSSNAPLLHEELIRRENFIKVWFISISHTLNEYMREKQFFKTFQIDGTFVDLGTTFKIKVNSKRPFSSRGKEPELFPVPLYSDDLLLDLIICSDGVTQCKSTTLKLNIGYFDLVFKHFDHSYLYKDEANLLTSLSFVRQNIRSIGVTTQPSVVCPILDIRLPSHIENIFLVRTPTFYEIWEDVINLQNNVGFYLKRLTTGKDEKDKIRLIKLFNKFMEFLNSIPRDNPNYATAQQLSTITQTRHIRDENPDKNNLIRALWAEEKTTIAPLMLAYPMEDTDIIQNCYYQHSKFVVNSNLRKVNYRQILVICHNSFREIFEPISAVYWGFVLWSKKYTELKDKSDMDRIKKINIDVLLLSVNPTSTKILSKFSEYRKNLIPGTPDTPIIYSNLSGFIRNILTTFVENPTIIAEKRSFTDSNGVAIQQGGYSKTRKNRKKPYSKPTRNKKSNLKSKSKTKSNKTKKNKKRRRKNNRSKNNLHIQ